MLVDTHCHLNFNSFDNDRPDVLLRAQRAGIVRILNPGIDLETSTAAVGLAESNNFVFAAVGVHPNDAQAWDSQNFAGLQQLAAHPKTVAIGEIGLDYYWDATPYDVQKRIFEEQLALAARVELPVVIHIRNKTATDHQATQDALAILRDWQRDIKNTAPALVGRAGVLHSFSDTPEFALQAIDMGFFIGITGPVTFKNAGVLREVVQVLPQDRLLIETDAPFLTPHPYRGKRNEPAYVVHVAEKIAELWGLDLERTSQIIMENAERLFLWQAIQLPR